jgi:TRAP-type C4-dicarboxylate transport system permease small subunit
LGTIFQLLGNGLRRFNQLMAILSAFLIFVATLVLVYEVITRYYLQIANDWVIELCVFLLIAATFLSAGYTQAERGHVGIEVLDEIMSAKWNRIRAVLGDILSLLVIVFIGLNAWHFTVDAYSQDWRSNSTWAPPLWIPYSLMAFGLTTLALQMFSQIVEAIVMPQRKRHAQNLMGA